MSGQALPSSRFSSPSPKTFPLSTPMPSTQGVGGWSVGWSLLPFIRKGSLRALTQDPDPGYSGVLGEGALPFPSE